MKRAWPLVLIPILVVWLALPRDFPVTSEAVTASAPAGVARLAPSLVTGAPLSLVETRLPAEAQAGSIPVTGSGAPTPRPYVKLGDWSCSDPPLCGETPQPRIVDGPTIAGEATWWNSFGGGYYVAIRPDLGTKGDLVIVCGGEPFHCRTAPAITTCACLGPNSERLVDLSRDLFSEFADPSLGVVRITLQVVGR